MIRQTEWMSNVLSKIAASELVDDDVEEELDELRRTVGVVQHHDAATGTERQAVADDYSRRMNRALQEGAEALNISASFVPQFLNKSKASFARFKSFRKGKLAYPGGKSILHKLIDHSLRQPFVLF